MKLSGRRRLQFLCRSHLPFAISTVRRQQLLLLLLLQQMRCRDKY